MPHRAFFAFIMPSLVAMLLFIALPIISVAVQSFYVQHERVVTEVETCTPFAGCTKETRVDAEATEKLRNEEPLGRFNGIGTNEVRFAWLELALANRYQPAVPAVERFLAAQGRRKFVFPLFETLWGEGDWGRPIAARIYARTRPSYHSVTSSAVDRLLGTRSQ